MGKPTHPTLRATETVALGEMIRRHREKSGLSQEGLGQLVGLAQARIAEIESAKRRVDVFEFLHIARGVNVDPLALFEEFMNACPTERND